MYETKYSNNLAFVDLLFNLLIGIAFLFIVSFLLINDPKKEENVRPMSEFMVILSWDGDKNSDIDLWVEGPSGVVGFQSPTSGFMFLDKDDLGHRNDYIWNDNGQKEILKINREIVNIRGFQSGEYIVNAHWYGGSGNYPYIPADIEVLKLNPFAVIHKSNFILKTKGEEKTLIRFTMDKEGNFSGKNKLKKTIVYRKRDITYGP